MTAEELKALDHNRKNHEDDLLLLLLLLLAFSVQQSIAEVGTDGEADSERAAAANLERLRVLLGTFGVEEIAGSMADAHLDAFDLFADGAERTDREALSRQYRPAATEMVDAMLDTIRKTGGATLAESLLLAKYSRSDSTGLELGAERQIVTASNAGLIDGAIRRTSGPRLEGFKHQSVLDDHTTKICQNRDGLQLPARDAYWEVNFPSLHWRCRSVVVPIFGRFTPSDWRPTTPPDVGFGRMPAAVRQMIRRLAA